MIQTQFSDDDSLSISRIMVVGEAQRNPFAVQAEAAMWDFMQKWNMQSPNFNHYCTISAFMFPAASLESLKTIGKLNCLCFYIDDCAVSYPLDTANEIPTDAVTAILKQEELASLGFIFRTGQLPLAPTNLQQAFYEVRQELLVLSGENTDYFSRLLDCAQQYLVKHSHPSAFVEKAADGTVDLQSYISWREVDCGMYIQSNMIEFADEIVLPETVIIHPILQRLRQSCNRIACLMNDIFSYYKEIVVEGNRFNLINLIQENTGIGLKEAVEEAINIVNGYTIEFLEYEKQLPYWDDKTDLAVKKYVEGLKSQISASWYWQISTPRYRSPHSPFRELRDLSNPEA